MVFIEFTKRRRAAALQNSAGCCRDAIQLRLWFLLFLALATFLLARLDDKCRRSIVQLIMRRLIAAESFNSNADAQPKTAALDPQISQVLSIMHVFVLPIVEGLPRLMQLKFWRHHRQKLILTGPFVGCRIGDSDE